jgi:hypothetical protein
MKERIWAWTIALVVLFMCFGFLSWRTANVINSTNSSVNGSLVNWDISAFMMGILVMLIVFALMNVILSGERR